MILDLSYAEERQESDATEQRNTAFLDPGLDQFPRNELRRKRGRQSWSVAMCETTIVAVTDGGKYANGKL